MAHIEVGTEPLDWQSLCALSQENTQLSLSQEVWKKVSDCRNYLDRKLRETDAVFYGINTGFGALCQEKIDKESLSVLQENLVKSHACGTGAPLQREISRSMLALKILSLSKGHSGIHPDTLTLLLELYNRDWTPWVPRQGSLGASGDLAPLAHLVLPLIGLGKLETKDGLFAPETLFAQHGLKPRQLQAKEGLALLNGTQFMGAVCLHALHRAEKSGHWANWLAALSIEAWMGHSSPFDALVHAVRPHRGQQACAASIRSLLKGSALQQLERKQVQDPYAFRCVPQVHGACFDVMDQVRQCLWIELNAVTDNPLIFPEEDKILSAGNFHGEPLALAADQLKLAVAELGSISERRMYKLLHGQQGLPEFLVAKPGLNSGFMIVQYSAASLVSYNKQLATPASVDSIDSSKGQEDHVSMGANAALQCLQMVEHTESVLGLELLTAAQALDFRRPKQSSLPLEQLHQRFRKSVPFVAEDQYMHPLMEEAIHFVRTQNPESHMSL